MYFDKEKNKQSRMDFVRLWATFVREHPDQEWSRQQNVVVNSMVRNAKNNPLSTKQYLELKKKFGK